MFRMASWLIRKNVAISTGVEASLPERYGWRTWALVLISVLVVHSVLFGIVHNLVDMRVCAVHLPDPLYGLVRFDARWTIVTVQAYAVAAVAILCGMLYGAMRGRQAPMLRLGVAVCLQSLLRCCTLLMLPACRATIPLGTPGPLHVFALNDPGFYALGMRGFALNDLVFSGHTGLFLLFLYATPAWPRPVRLSIACFTLLMVYGLLATREHYTIDILLAIPCSFFADRMALTLIGDGNRAVMR